MTSLILIALLTVNPIAACLLDLDSQYIATDVNNLPIDKTNDNYLYIPTIRIDTTCYHMLSTQSRQNSHDTPFEQLNKFSTISILSSLVKTSIFF